MTATMSQFGFTPATAAAGSPPHSSSATHVAVASPSPVAASSSAPPPPGSPPAVVAPVPAAPGSAPLHPAAPGRCCDSGRPLFTDPITGQSVCSCQYDPQTHLLNYQRLATAGIPLSMYSAPYGEQMAAYFPSLGAADQPPFYATAPGGLELKDNLPGAPPGWPYPSVYHPYDAAFGGYPFNGYGMDLNGARRKNATRETTSTLKAWLNEHKKNPYPTKGEKIMLAIITKMTLTQVSTWFANARRRLKKENKMTWEPRNRVEDDDNNNDDDDRPSRKDSKDHLDSKDSGTASSEDGDRPHHRLDMMSRPPRPDTGTGSDWSDARPDSGPDSPEYLYEKSQPAAPVGAAPPHLLHHPAVKMAPGSPPSDGVAKPRIWSLADMASKESDHHHQSVPAPHHLPPHHPASAFYSKLVPSAAMAARAAAAAGLAQPPPHHPMYGRGPGAPPHPDLYRLYSSAAHLHGGDVALLESYSRQFALNGAGNGAAPLSMLSKAVAAAGSAAAAAGFLNGGATPIPPPSAAAAAAAMEHQLQSAGLLTKVSASPPPPHTALPDKSPPSSNGGAATAAKA